MKIKNIMEIAGVTALTITIPSVLLAACILFDKGMSAKYRRIGETIPVNQTIEKVYSITNSYYQR